MWSGLCVLDFAEGPAVKRDEVMERASGATAHDRMENLPVSTYSVRSATTKAPLSTFGTLYCRQSITFDQMPVSWINVYHDLCFLPFTCGLGLVHVDELDVAWIGRRRSVSTGADHPVPSLVYGFSKNVHGLQVP